MSLVGAGLGASVGLDEILERALRQKAIEDRKEVDLAAIEQRRQEATDQREHQRRIIELQDLSLKAAEKKAEIEANQEDEQKRAFDNVAGLGAMGLEPLTARREAAVTLGRSGVQNPQAFARDAFPEPEKPELKTYTHTDPKTGRQTLRSITLDEIQRIGGVDMGAEPVKPTTPTSRSYLTIIDNDGNQRRVPDGPEVNELLGQGWKLFDPVAARSSKPADDPEARETANEVHRLASSLRKHKGFKGVFGLHGSYVPTFRQDTADAEQLLTALTGMLTMENMDKMKGVLSDADIKMLKQASTTLNPRMGDMSAAEELDRIVKEMGKYGGNAPAAPAAPNADQGDEIDNLINRLRKPKG